MASTMQGVRWRIRCYEYAGDLSDVVSADLSVSETAGRCAIQCDAYDGGGYDGNTENDDI